MSGAAGPVSDADLGEIRGAGVPNAGIAYRELAADEPIRLARRSARTLMQSTEGGAAPQATPVSEPAEHPDGPVGEAPPEQEHQQVEALPEGQNTLLGAGRLVIEPSFEYARSSSNRLVFRGVEIVSGIQIGLIEANDTARDTISAAVAARYAVTDRLEVEARIPYLYRNDRVTTLSQNDAQQTQTFELNGSNMGDAEMSARYQLNRGKPGGSVFVAGLRVKSDTGTGPFDVARDEQGVSTELATGSGFWGVQGSLSFMYPSDPVVLYGNVSYLYNMPRDIDQQIGQVMIGRVDPGDSIGVGFGFGFAVNPRISYSIGYSHSYVLPTESELDDTTQRSTELQVGTVQLGLSFRATERLTLATGVDIGVTQDAPDVRVSLRTPFRF
ncbi:transporter [Terricaulis sp.]|uniref:transporter n=1 Tax=Terricaulis sp. TaxID=2768686 RepID=UPI0037849200